jgi:hypothetical protein
MEETVQQEGQPELTLKQQHISHDFNLPNHNNQLSKADDIIEKLKKRIEIHITQKTLDLKNFTPLYEEVVRVLDYVGRLSMPAFAIEDELEEMYTLKFHHSPELGKKLWLDHYETIHHPYTVLKNRCFKLLELLDETYMAMYDKNPPNWNY